MNGMVKVKDVLPLVKWNDVRLVLGKEDEICLLRKDFIAETLSDKILGMMVTGIYEFYSYAAYHYVSYWLCVLIFFSRSYHEMHRTLCYGKSIFQI